MAEETEMIKKLQNTFIKNLSSQNESASLGGHHVISLMRGMGDIFDIMGFQMLH